MKPFDLKDFHAIQIGDRPVLEPMILNLEPETCELNFFNLFTWSKGYQTVYQIWAGLPWFYFQHGDELLFPGGNNQEMFPSPACLAEVSDRLIESGKSGTVFLAPEKYLETPGLTDYFEPEQVTAEFGEYIHETQHLAELHGGKLAKKKNLISQFIRNHPDYQVVPLTQDRIEDCRRLDRQWTDSKTTANDPHCSAIAGETDALEKMWQYYGDLDTEGYCVYADHHLVAFSLFNRINHEMTIEHYEKSDLRYKGAAQLVNRESAKALQSKFRYINREQDLGFEGLRHAKMSYAPDRILLNWNLKRKRKTK